MRIYLAAPFFTPEENAVCTRMAAIMRNNGHHVFEPSCLGIVRMSDPEDRLRIYQSNVAYLLDSDIVVAWLERDNGPDANLALVRRTPGSIVNNLTVMRLPDTGTVFEIGYAAALSKPVVGFRLDGSHKLNLMLTTPLIGLMTGFADLDRAAETNFEKTTPVDGVQYEEK